MQRMAFEPGLEPPDLEEENRRARNEVLRNVAIFGAIVILLRVGRLNICKQSWGTVSFPDHFLPHREKWSGKWPIPFLFCMSECWRANQIVLYK